MMNALFLRLGVIAMGLAPIAHATPARAQAGYDSVPEVVDFCQWLVRETDSRWTVGTCLASLIADGEALDSFVCLYWDRNGLLEQYGFANRGECIKGGDIQP